VSTDISSARFQQLKSNLANNCDGRLGFAMKPGQHVSGFTLIELLAVIAVIALLAVLLLPALS
jgi:prepilin-type N-terminal cleavage/methylation domain-containing protein